MVRDAVSQFIYLSAEPGKFGLNVSKATGEVSALWRRALADLANLPGQLADVPFDLVEPLAQLHVFGGWAFLWPEHYRPVALMRGEAPLLAQHGKRLPVRADRNPVTAGMLTLRGKPIARLEPTFFDRRSQVISDLLVGRPRVAGIRSWHCTSLRCARPPSPNSCQVD